MNVSRDMGRLESLLMTAVIVSTAYQPWYIWSADRVEKKCTNCMKLRLIRISTEDDNRPPDAFTPYLPMDDMHEDIHHAIHLYRSI